MPGSSTPEVAGDALCELATIGVGNAATALSKLLGGHQVLLAVPQFFRDATVCSTAAADREGVAVRIRIDGVLRATFVLWLEMGSARGAVGQLLGQQLATGWMGDTATSALLECGNVAACAFADAVAELARSPVVPAPPEVVYGTLADVLLTVSGGHASVAVVTQLTVDTLHVEGWVAVVLDARAVPDALAGMGVTGRE